MELQVVSLLQSKLLKQLNFEWITNDFYLGGLLLCDPVGFLSEKTDNLFLAPTVQLSLKWLREIHNIFVDISTDQTMEPKYVYSVTEYLDHNWNNILYPSTYSDIFYTYESASSEALDQSILYLLSKIT